ncbi:MAG: AAA family ATPase [Candidatus Poribacteria bacterium]|nr:AAA family ATPase [Candidatus Poribacteria bacterium]
MPKLFVKNFINIQEAEIDMDKTLVVFIGATASGKSVLAKLLYFFHELIRDFRQYIKQINAYPPEDIKPVAPDLSTVFRAQILYKFREFFGDASDLTLITDNDDVIKPFEITYHWTTDSTITLTLDAEKTLEIQLPSVMDEVETLCYALQEKLRQFDKKQLSSKIKEADLPTKVDTSSTDNEPESKTSERFFFILKMAIGISDITEKLAGTYRDSLFIPADRNIAVNYPDALKRIFYGGIKSDLQTRAATRPRVNLHLIARFLEKNEEFLDTFSTQNFHNIFDEKAEAESESIDKPMMEFLLKKISCILRSEYETIGEISESRLFSHPTGENAAFLEKASTGQQNIIRILQDMFMNVLYNEVIFRVIEEPEAHLHPIAQKHLMHIIALMRNHIDSQIVITTHSPYLLAVLKNLLTAGQLSGKKPEAAAETEALTPKLCWLNPDDVEVYHLKDGISHAIVQPEAEPILENPLADLLAEF